jgi:hypothetical protein
MRNNACVTVFTTANVRNNRVKSNKRLDRVGTRKLNIQNPKITITMYCNIIVAEFAWIRGGDHGDDSETCPAAGMDVLCEILLLITRLKEYDTTICV